MVGHEAAERATQKKNQETTDYSVLKFVIVCVAFTVFRHLERPFKNIKV